MIDKKVLISVVVPIYNTSSYLEQCVMSILNQRLNNIEVILVNDGSTDESGDICDSYANKYDNVKVIHKKNGGLSDARNAGIIAAIGEYILFIDSDDFIKEKSLSKIVDTIQEDKEVELIFLEAYKVYPNKEKISLGDGYIKDKIFNKSKKEVMNHIKELPKFPGSACSKLIKRNLIINNNLTFEKDLLCEDLDWTIRVLLACQKFNYCEYEYYYYRQQRQGSITNTYSVKKFEDLLYIIEKYIKISETSEFKSTILNFIAYEYNILLFNYSYLNKNQKLKYIERMKSISWVMRYRKDIKNRLIKLSYTLLGINITSELLKKYMNFREK